MNPRLPNYLLTAAAALIVVIPALAQPMRPNEFGVYASIKQTTALKISRNLTTSPRALPFSMNGPADPTDPTRPLVCNKSVQREFREAFMKTRNGEDRMGLAEAGRSIELSEGAIAFGPWATTDLGDGERANRMNMVKDDSTIAFFHTHGNRARAVPSARDLKGEVPDFVISQFAIYVTIPGTESYLRLDPTVCKR